MQPPIRSPPPPSPNGAKNLFEDLKKHPEEILVVYASLTGEEYVGNPDLEGEDNPLEKPPNLMARPNALAALAVEGMKKAAEKAGEAWECLIQFIDWFPLEGQILTAWAFAVTRLAAALAGEERLTEAEDLARLILPYADREGVRRFIRPLKEILGDHLAGEPEDGDWPPFKLVS
ncbi:MAG: hypothetical protein LBR53_09945 [Deltaproteobacteria bacterium]|nr:hypothetical protein [Deltaproteobacteria bacterium]